MRRFFYPMTGILILVPLLVLGGFDFPGGQDETLYWAASHRLQFSDFRGRPGSIQTDAAHRGDGRIAGTIIKSIVADTRKRNGRLFFVVHASMKPRLSWITKRGDSTALRHEQGHFDICEIYARLLRGKIGQAASVAEAKKMWNQVLDEEETEQTRYDSANSYLAGGITATWMGIIRARLKSLEAFGAPEVPAMKMK